METVLVNLVGKTRRVTLHSREYIVAPMTMIVSGVLNGSQGALYYPPEEVARNAADWNAMPLLLGHPTKDGQHISGRSPDVWEANLLGHVFNAVADDGTLRAEGWFDVSAVKRIDSRILRALEDGRPLELSTGLFTDNDLQPGVHNGKKYDAIARNYKPDHLAVLVDERGACSLDDGCGVLANEEQKRTLLQKLLGLFGYGTDRNGKPIVNSAGELVPVNSEEVNLMKLTADQRKSIVSHLTANCECWKGQGETLNKLTDEQLAKLKADSAKLAIVNQIVANKGKLARNAEGEGEVAGVAIPEAAALFGIEVDPAQDPIGFAKALQAAVEEFLKRLTGNEPAAAAPAAEELVASAECLEGEEMVDGVCAPKPAPAANRGKRGVARPPTEAEWMASAPPAIQSAVRNAMGVEKAERRRLVAHLTANLQGEVKVRLGTRLLAKPLDELRELAALVPQRDEQPTYAPSYYGASAPAVNYGDQDDSANLLPEPTTNFEEMASPKLRRQTA